MEFDESLSTTNTSSVLKEVKEKVDALYSLKLAVDAADKKYKDAKNELSKIMEEAGVDKMQGDLCNVNLALKSSVSVPKDEAKKYALFSYIIREHGQTVMDAMLTINARTFSSWYDREVEAQVNAGNADFKLDMIEPYEYYSLGMRKRAVKK